MGGILGAWGFQKLRVPQVIGYIAIGLIIESVSRSRREMKRLFYLQLPPPGTRRHEPR